MGFAFICPALPTYLVVYVQKSGFHLINVLCAGIVLKKRKLLCLAQVVFSYYVLHSNKIPLVVTTKVTHLGSLLCRQPDRVNCVGRSLFGGIPKHSSAVSGVTRGLSQEGKSSLKGAHYPKLRKKLRNDIEPLDVYTSWNKWKHPEKNNLKPNIKMSTRGGPVSTFSLPGGGRLVPLPPVSYATECS